uniref:Elongator complex protein 6-like n=1 Tax=Rhizophora mucronata TaxID=61149 RepID=A0A2P2JPZ5_RHIMU
MKGKVEKVNLLHCFGKYKTQSVHCPRMTTVLLQS